MNTIWSKIFSWHTLVTILAVMMSLVLLMSAYGGCIDPRSWSFPALMVMALPIVAAVAVASLLLCLILRNRTATIIVGATLIISLPAIRTIIPLSWNSEPDNRDNTFTVMTWNVCGFNQMIDGAEDCATMRHILDVDADLVVMQEYMIDYSDISHVPNAAALKDEVAKRYPYRSNGYADIALFSKVPFTITSDTTMRNCLGLNGDGSYHESGKIFDLKIKGHDLRIVSVHMQSIGLNDDEKKLSRPQKSVTNKLTAAFKRRANEAHAVRKVLDQSPENVIMCGDFNDVPSSYCYRTIKGNDMSDSHIDCATWPVTTYNKDKLYFKIDYMLYRGHMKAVNTRRDEAGASDHYPLITTFEWTTDD